MKNLKELKFIPGKDYRMKNGQKAKFLAVAPNEINVFYHYDDGNIYRYNGTRLDLHDDDIEYDIISEWEEPRKPRVYYRNEYKAEYFHGWFLTPDSAKKCILEEGFVRTVKFQEVIE